MQCHANSFARIEFECSLRDGDNSLISNISCTKQLRVLQNLILILLVICGGFLTLIPGKMARLFGYLNRCNYLEIRPYHLMFFFYLRNKIFGPSLNNNIFLTTKKSPM